MPFGWNESGKKDREDSAQSSSAKDSGRGLTFLSAVSGGTSTGQGSATQSAQLFANLSSAKISTVIGANVKIVGKLTFNESVEIDGKVEGDMTSTDLLAIGENGDITGNIDGAEVVVKGKLKGDIKATKRVALRKNAKVTGNISSPTLSIEEGAVFEGRCAMAFQNQTATKTEVEKEKSYTASSSTTTTTSGIEVNSQRTQAGQQATGTTNTATQQSGKASSTTSLFGSLMTTASVPQQNKHNEPSAAGSRAILLESVAVNNKEEKKE
ncbi:MAG TPA: polymer-forming cytoskeletal protein [Oligoflexia bacterium]|nr:polymer-forming cytoskeletal protein [Oligoflexia bacterium]HMP26836.1 polymer-forming cytoskeletal protein [Oligoflexia bacterium]